MHITSEFRLYALWFYDNLLWLETEPVTLSIHCTYKIYISVPNFVQETLESSVTLHCPIDEPRSNRSHQAKVWYRQPSQGYRTFLGRMGIKDDNVISNVIVGKRKADMWFGSIDGDLNIRNLRWEDEGFYICHFTGSEEKTVHLSIEGMLFYVHSMFRRIICAHIYFRKKHDWIHTAMYPKSNFAHLSYTTECSRLRKTATPNNEQVSITIWCDYE